MSDVTDNYGWTLPAMREKFLEDKVRQLAIAIDADLAAGIGAVSTRGVWTPVVTIGGSSVGITYTTQTGNWERVGKQVTVWCRITLSSKGGLTGSVLITGLPVAAQSPEATGRPYINQASYTGSLLALAGSGSSALSLWVANGGTSSQLGGANINDTFDLALSLTYRVS